MYAKQMVSSCSLVALRIARSCDSTLLKQVASSYSLVATAYGDGLRHTTLERVALHRFGLGDFGAFCAKPASRQCAHRCRMIRHQGNINVPFCCTRVCL